MSLVFIINHLEYKKFRKESYEHNISSLFSELGEHIKRMADDLSIKVLITFKGVNALELNFIDEIEEEVILFKMILQKFKHIKIFKLIDCKGEIS